jgi:uncharacterized membrane protein YhaH (DUF805 family)
MDWGSYFFSFQGRINRAKLWLFIPIVIGIYIAYFMLFSVLFGTSIVAMMKGGPAGLAAGGASIGAAMILTCILFLVILVASLALAVKRLHDRDKGAIWLLVFWLLPVVLNSIVLANRVATMSTETGTMPPVNAAMGLLSLVSLGVAIWAFVELYCLRGTAGDNRFGPDPLAAPQSTP